MLDRLIALVAFVSVAGYLSVFLFRVRSSDLLIVIIIVMLMIAFDFGTQLLRRRR